MSRHVEALATLLLHYRERGSQHARNRRAYAPAGSVADGAHCNSWDFRYVRACHNSTLARCCGETRAGLFHGLRHRKEGQLLFRRGFQGRSLLHRRRQNEFAAADNHELQATSFQRSPDCAWRDAVGFGELADWQGSWLKHLGAPKLVSRAQAAIDLATAAS
jgi:hypothetical protein